MASGRRRTRGEDRSDSSGWGKAAKIIGVVAAILAIAAALWRAGAAFKSVEAKLEIAVQRIELTLNEMKKEEEELRCVLQFLEKDKFERDCIADEGTPDGALKCRKGGKSEPFVSLSGADPAVCARMFPGS